MGYYQAGGLVVVRGRVVHRRSTGYYPAGDYYMAGGFFSSIGKALKKVAKAVYKPIVKPLIKMAVAAVPGAQTISNALAHVDPTNPRGIVGTLLGAGTAATQVVGNPALGVAPASSTMGRMSQLLSPSSAPAGMPMEGSNIGALFYQSLSSDERTTLVKAVAAYRAKQQRRR